MNENILIQPPDLPKRICDYPPCGKSFTPKRRWQRFCADRCRELDWQSHQTNELRIKKLEGQIRGLECLIKSTKTKEREDERRETGNLIGPETSGGDIQKPNTE